MARKKRTKTKDQSQRAEGADNKQGEEGDGEDKPADDFFTKLWKGWIKPIIIVVVVLSTLRSAVADWNDVPSGSMLPTIIEGDRIFVNKLAYDLKIPFTTWQVIRWDQPERGDIIVLWSPDHGTGFFERLRLVKRVVAVPGDTIQLKHNALIINGKEAQYQPLTSIDPKDAGEIELRLEGSHAFEVETVDQRSHPVMRIKDKRTKLHDMEPYTLKDGEYFVMGDNRDHSKDSRLFGIVKRELIVGKAKGVAFSLDYDNFYLPRFERFFHGLE